RRSRGPGSRGSRRARVRRGARGAALSAPDALAQDAPPRLFPVEGLRRARALRALGGQVRRGQALHAHGRGPPAEDARVREEAPVPPRRPVQHHGPRGPRSRHRAPGRRAAAGAAARPVPHPLSPRRQAALRDGREDGRAGRRGGPRGLVQRPRLPRRARRSVLPLLPPRGRTLPPRVPADPAGARREAAVSGSDREGPGGKGEFKQDYAVDKPGIVGARWWHQGLQEEDRQVSRRQALLALGVGGGAIAALSALGVGVAVLANRKEKTGLASRQSLIMQRTYGWDFGARGVALVWNGQAEGPLVRSQLAKLPA